MPTRPIQLAKAQRAAGQLRLSFKRGGDHTRIASFYQQGSLKARLPRALTAGWAEAVTLNISGGVAGGDVLATNVVVMPGACAAVVSQAAERVYRTLEAPAQIDTKLAVGAGGMLEYLPQETILFDGFSLRRSLEVSLHPQAAFLGVESLVFGRLAMGETAVKGKLRDRITLRRAGQLVLQDMSRLEGDISALLGRRALGGGATASACILYVASDAQARLPALRLALASAHAGATCFESILFARILAPDGRALRARVISALNSLRDGRHLPRVWQG